MGTTDSTIHFSAQEVQSNLKGANYNTHMELERQMYPLVHEIWLIPPLNQLLCVLICCPRRAQNSCSKRKEREKKEILLRELYICPRGNKEVEMFLHAPKCWCCTVAVGCCVGSSTRGQMSRLVLCAVNQPAISGVHVGALADRVGDLELAIFEERTKGYANV